MLHHESHELGGITTNVEEVKAVLLDKGLKGGVGSNADAVAVGVLQYLPQGNEGLDITARADDLNDNVKARRWLLTR